MAILIQTTIVMVGLALTPPSTAVVGGTVVEVTSSDSQEPDDEGELPQNTSGEPAVVHTGTSEDGTNDVPVGVPVAESDNGITIAESEDDAPGAEPAQGASWQALSPAYHERSALPITGRAMYYNPGVMERVLEYRVGIGNVQPCAECIGYAAMLRYGDLNRKVWIQLPDSTVEGPFLVIDAADVKHVHELLQRNWAIDIDYETAMRWRMAGPRPVTVLDKPPQPPQPPQPPRQDVLAVDLIPPKNKFIIDIYRRTKMKHTSSMGEYMDEIEGLYLN